jgi:hypothetical protein
MASKQKALPLLLNTHAPIGEASVFKSGQSYIVYYKQNGFLPRSMSTTDEKEVKEFLLASRIISEANYDRIMDPDTPPVMVAESAPIMPDDEDFELDDGFDEIVEN